MTGKLQIQSPYLWLQGNWAKPLFDDIPYVSIVSSSGYWAGVSIHNPQDSDEYFNLRAYNADGESIATGDCWLVPAGGTITKLVPGFFTSIKIEGRVTLHITSNSTMTEQFPATLFIGNNGTSNPGFGFQTYYSGDVSKLLPTMCFIVPFAKADE